jgi:rsbT co-antagonist protein RsbR
MLLRERLAALEHTSVPTWVFDADYFRQRWANRAALELWRAKTPEELYERDYSDMSASARARMQGYIEGFRNGRNAEEQWTLYPKGKPVTMKLFLTGIPLDDQRIGVLIQAFEKEEGASPDLLRALEVFRHASIMATLIDFERKIILQNPAAIRFFGSSPPFAARFPDQTVVDSLVDQTRAGEVYSIETRIQTEVGLQWHDIEARTVPDPASGGQLILVQQSDVTARRTAEFRADAESKLALELRATLDLVERQRAEIIEISAPLLEVSARTIAVPIVGKLDAERANELESRVLSIVSERGARCVILDLTGVDIFSTTQTAEQVARIGRAIRLLGAQTIVTGISSSLARTLISADIHLGEVKLLRSLREGIRLAAQYERH